MEGGFFQDAPAEPVRPSDGASSPAAQGIARELTALRADVDRLDRSRRRHQWVIGVLAIALGLSVVWPRFATVERPDPPTPETRLIKLPGGQIATNGQPVACGDGQTWRFPDVAGEPSFDKARRKLFEGSDYSPWAKVNPGVANMDITATAVDLLRYNYELTHAEALDIVTPTDPQILRAAVKRSLIGEGNESR